MIYTGDCEVSASARWVLESAAEHARMQGASFAACDDLLAALSDCPDGQVAGVLKLFGRSRLDSHLVTEHGIEEGVANQTIRPALNHILPNRPLQLAIELASDGPAITTGSLLLGLVRAGCSSTASWLRRSNLTEADVVRAVEQCAPDAMRPAVTT